MILDLIKKNWKDIAIAVGVVFIILYFVSPKVEEVEVPVTIEVPIPVIEKEFDTIKIPTPVYIKSKPKKVIDSVYYNKYKQLKDSVAKDSVFKDAITINEYNTKFEDDTLTINIFSKTRGTLLEQVAKYKTKPRVIPFDTIIKVKIPPKAKLFGGFSLGVPIRESITDVEPIVKADLILKTKGDNLINLSFDNRGRAWVGVAWKFGKKSK